MMSHRLHIVVALVIASLMVTACNAPPRGSAEPGTGASTPTSKAQVVASTVQATVTPYPTIPPPQAEEVPVFPGAREISYDKVYETDWRRISFHTDGTLEEVSTFYESRLAEDGWIVDKENESARWGKYLRFFWSDSIQTLPWDLILDINIEEITATSDRWVNITLERVPQIDRIPLYTDAYSVEKKQLPNETIQFTDKHTWYSTAVAPDVVEAYYRDVLLQHGWTGPESNSDITTKGIVFGAGYGTIHEMIFYKLTITASPVSPEETRVHLKVEGTIPPRQ